MVPWRGTTGPQPGRQGLVPGLAFALMALWLLVGATTPLAAHADEPAKGRVVFDIDDPPDLNYQVTDWLTFGAEIDAELFFRNNLDLDDGADDRLAGLTPELGLAFAFEFGPSLEAFLGAKLEQGVDFIAPGREPSREASLSIDEAYLTLKEPVAGLSLRIGRERIADSREWLVDQELDGVHAFARWENLCLELAANRLRLVDEDLLNRDRRERINNYFAIGRYAPNGDTEAGATILVRDNQAPGTDDLTYFAFQGRTTLADDWNFWLDAAHVRGREDGDQVRGTAVDAGTTYAPDLPLEPSVTLGFAFATGDDGPGDGVDHAYRQTGLQENRDAFNGVTRFSYYGEAFDPELSNMAILTAGLGIKPSEGSSLDLVYHRYWQHHASDFLRDSALEVEPGGSNRHLGDGLDLIFGLTELEPVEFELRLGAFFPGAAFEDSRDPAYSAVFETVIGF